MSPFWVRENMMGFSGVRRGISGNPQDQSHSSLTNSTWRARKQVSWDHLEQDAVVKRWLLQIGVLPTREMAAAPTTRCSIATGR